MEGPESFAANSWNPKEAQIGKLYEIYVQRLKDANALDFDDLLLRTVELFDKAPTVRERYAHKFRFVMVDEYQDTNRPQYLLIQQLAGLHRNLCVVGDPDQSIYKWRGADLKNILDFEHDFPEAMIVRLERNYRSTQVILDAASAVIAQNARRVAEFLVHQEGECAVVIVEGTETVRNADHAVRSHAVGLEVHAVTDGDE